MCAQRQSLSRKREAGATGSHLIKPIVHLRIRCFHPPRKLIMPKPKPLFRPVVLAGHELPHRVVMAPMTRSRSTQPGDVPNAMNARYYAQRASAALIVTEASQISPQGKGYSFTPGIYSANQIEGWRLVTQSVHAAGGRIFLQLWHVGRMSHPDFHDGELPVAPSAVPFDGQVWKVDPATGVGAMVACPTPRALTQDEIRSIVEDFRRAARNAIQAGFDGVEIHGANGYLVDQFLRTTSNLRRIRWLACEPPALPRGGRRRGRR
jgi:N-ethylmaleimide reductase